MAMLWGAQCAMVGMVIGLSPLFYGAAQITKARCQGRRGPSVWWGYWLLLKNWHKETTVPEYSSPIFRLAPSVSVAAVLVVVGLIPWGGRLPAGWPHDLLAFFFLLALERFWVALAGLDTAGTFGGLGASRIATLGTGIEPALISAFAILWATTHGTAIVSLASRTAWLPWTLALASYALVMLAELGRLPVDNVDTHLELTMMHEATLLEYNGRLLAQSQAAMMLKYTAMIGLGWAWLSPAWPSLWLTALTRLAGLLATSVAIGWAESRVTKLRFFQLPAYLALASGLGLLAFYLVTTGGFS
jgi:formate hydrogenlyase subunit 4